MEQNPTPLRAQWLDRRTITLPIADVHSDCSYQLVYSPEHPAIELTANPGTVGQFTLPVDIDVDSLKAALKGELTVIGFAGQERKYLTGVQTAGVLDDLFPYNGNLGANFGNEEYENITITVWAPTARSVKLLLYRGADDTDPADTVPMLESNGVWSAEIEPSWRTHYYLFSVNVYVPRLRRLVENVVTDPYSADLALNGVKSRLTDLNDPLTKPEGWDEHKSPALASNNDLTIWELHVRDFSANDPSVPDTMRGAYLAFTQADSHGMSHLRRLIDAGIKAVHLLPTFHIASINEDKSKWQTPTGLSAHAPDSSDQQAAVTQLQNVDPYNWGYDPVHFFAPEGSYAVDANQRVKEYRLMVQALHRAGLKVIQDQVFNHTSANGQHQDSILDKIVPGYYYRLDSDGNVLNATCCSDTASERRMMEKLMVDCVAQNVRHYKIDGFRFDLMGYHYVSNMRRIQAALPPDIYLYGEGWYAAETAGNPQMPAATQANMYGAGIGTFNDRIRDAVRGGNPFSDLRAAGFVTGMDAQSDLVRAGLAGNMRDFSFLGSQNQTITAAALNYNGQPVGYTANPIECVNFCSVHDNQTLFDAIQLKSPPEDSTAIRARRQVLALSIIALGQGIPFFHAGDELLRSKSMDHNSYNSGDWFNKLDFTYETNNWGIGLPPAADNEQSWSIMQPLLSNPALTPSRADILYTRDAFESLLRVRASSGLFRLRTLAEVQRNLSFFNVASGVIAMRLNANGFDYGPYQNILVIFNAGAGAVSVQDSSVKALHPALSVSAEFDLATGTAKVDALTTAVFV